MNEYKLKGDYKNIKKNLLDKIEEIVADGDIYADENKDIINDFLQKVDYNHCNSVCEFIASLFNVDRADILTCDKHNGLVHARWMYWKTLKFIFLKTHREIAVLSSIEGHFVNAASINIGIKNLEEEMKMDYLLQQKWDIVKKLVYLGKDRKDEMPKEDMNVKILKPKGVNIDIVDK